MKFVRIIILFLFFVLVIALIFQNQEVFNSEFEIGLNLWFSRIGPYKTYNIVLIAIAFLVGVILAVIWGAFYAVSMRRQIKEKGARIKELETQRREVQVSPVNETTIEKVK